MVAWNATGKLVTASIGQPPIGYAWVRVMDTALASPQDCALSYVNLAGPNGTYLVAPHAAERPFPLRHWLRQYAQEPLLR